MLVASIIWCGLMIYRKFWIGDDSGVDLMWSVQL